MPATRAGSGSWTVVRAFPNLTFEDPTLLTFEPRTNRLYVGGRQGVIWSFVNQSNVTSKTTFLDLRARTQGWGDCGLLGMAFHPDFNLPGSPNRRYVYVYYSYSPSPTPGPGQPPDDTPAFNRLSRFTVPEGSLAADPNSELVLINQYDRHIWHNGGGMFFGNDGFLYLTIGDEGGMSDFYNTAQKLNFALRSGVFRIDVNQDPTKSHPIRRQPQSGGAGSPPSFTGNYYIPNDNPFVNPNGSVLEEYWALGLRSPHRMTYDPASGRIWLGDVGQDWYEELNLIERGGNYQWPFRDGPVAGPKPPPAAIIGTSRPPIHYYTHQEGDNCIIGGYVYRGQQHAADLGGKYIFGDNGSGRIWALAYDGFSAPQITFLCSLPPATTYLGLSSFGVDQNGELYLCKLGANGVLYRLARTSPPPPLPARLSLTGAFSSVGSLTPATGVIPYTLNVPFWSDRAVKQRWIALPNDGAPYGGAETAGFSATGEWTFPNGTVFVKHFDLPLNETNPAITKRLETRLLVRDNSGGVYGATYKWRADNTDADLLPGSLNENIVIQTPTGTRVQTWYYPSQEDCLTCHNQVGVLGLNTRQLNCDFTYPSTGRTDNQLRTWNHVGLLNPPINEGGISNYAKLAPVNDLSASLEHRVRSYLDVNCAQCHRPGGVHAQFDARFDTPLSSQNIIDGPVGNNAGIPGAKVIAPGSVPQSMAYLRMNSTNQGFLMPPLARREIDSAAVAVMADWINSLAPSSGALPDPWLHQDVGAVGAPGGARYTNGTFTVEGSGVDIWYMEDEFHFVHQSLNGDGQIVARVVGVQNTDPWAKAGVMMRETLDPGARNLFVMVSAVNGTGFQWRDAPNASTDGALGPAALAPYWVRLTRAGNIFSAETSPDGASWSLIGTRTNVMTPSIYVGLAVCARNDGQTNTSTFSNVQVISAPPGGSLPPPWLSQDVGGVAAAGHASFAGGTFTVGGSGNDIWYTADEFRFVYRPLTGNGEIIARVGSIQNTDPWAKAGVMMREDFDPGARAALAVVTAGNGTGFQWREAPGLASDGLDGPLVNAPHWLKLSRMGNVFSAYTSPDGVTWTLIGSHSIAMADTIHVGLAVCSRNDGVVNTSTFSNVQLNTLGAGAGLPPPWSNQDVGPVAAAGSASFTNGTFTVGGSGADIWGNADEFQFVYQTMTGNGQVVARINSIGNSHEWAKAGVMMRETLDSGARYAMTFLSRSNGSLFQWRSEINAPSGVIGALPVLPPYWVRLTRSGSNFTSHASADGTNWTLIGNQTVSMAATLYVGLAVSSHNDGVIQTSTFSNVQAGTNVATQALPPPWVSQDVGAVAAPGNVAYHSGTFTVQGSGADIWTSADEFHFVHRELNGNGEIIARVDAVENTSSWAKGGVMMRQSTNSGSPYAMVVVTGGNGTGFQIRTNENSPTDGWDGPFVGAPYWVRLVRSGDNFTAYTSPDGVTWTWLRNEVVVMGASIRVGLAVSSNNDGTLNTSAFSAVQVITNIPDYSLPAPWLDQDIGAVAANGSTLYSNGVFFVKGSGADIWGAADEFRFAYRTLTNDGQIIARVDSVQNTAPWAKGGVMMRETLTAGSPYAMTVLTASNGVGFQWRALADGPSDGMDGPSAGAPYWVRLARSGSNFIAYASANGSNWTLIGTQTLAMNSVLYVGLAVSSVNDGQLNTSIFSSVRVGGDPTPKLRSVEFDNQGRMLLHLDGEVGRAYQILTSTNLKDWTNLTTIESLTGPTLILDSNTAGQRHKFYRAVLLP